MMDWWILLLGCALVGLGLVSRRPWGRWWDGGGESAEQVATLMLPASGIFVILLFFFAALEDGWFKTLVSFAAVLSFLAALWIILMLPVPNRLLVKPSSIRQARVRRRASREARREQRRTRRGDHS